MEEFFYILQKVKNSRINLEKDEEYLLMMPELFKKVCRLCLGETDNLQPISTAHQNKPKYSSLITSLIDINLESHDDDFHSMICEECASNLTLFFKFREKIETNNETLTRLKSMIDRIKHPMKLEQDKQYIVIEHVKQHNKYSTHVAQHKAQPKDEDDSQVLQLPIDESYEGVQDVSMVDGEEEIEVLTSVQEDYTASFAGESVDVNQMKEEPEPNVETIEEEMEEEVGESEFLDPSWCDEASNTKIEVVKATDNNGIRCVVCFRAFDDIERLERHMTKRHDKDEDDMLAEQESTREAVTSQADPELYVNIGEDIEMISEQRLDEIQKQTTVDTTDDESEAQVVKPKRRLKHRCLICRHPFDGAKKLARHMTTHEEGYKGRKFAPILEKLEIIEGEELDPPLYDTSYIVKELRNKRYTCPICELPVDSPSKLKKHLMTHTKTEDGIEANTAFVCSVCFCAFPTEEYLDAHEKQHDQKSRQYPRMPMDFEPLKKGLLCELCGRNFQNRSSFILHLPQHTGQKPFKCEVCDMRFTRKHHVKIHMRTHNDFKPFSCEICGMAFTKSGNLNRHLAVHSSDRNYRCEICAKAFKRKNDLPKHMITHTGERNFKCTTCNKTYTSRSGLVKHWKHHPKQNVDTDTQVVVTESQIEATESQNTDEIPVYEASVEEGGQLTILAK